MGRARIAERLKPRREIYIVSAAGIVLAVCYELVFGRYFSPHNPGIGHDYGLFLTWLLDGYYWYLNNGLFSLHWFSPSFCGGVPVFPNPQSPGVSLLQLFTIFTNPLNAVHITFLAFALAGFAGWYLLLRRSFDLQWEISLYGATLFMFNGFYVYKMIIGALAYHSFMLLPYMGILLLDRRQWDWESMVVRIGLAALLFAYMIYSGLVHLFIPVVLSIVLIGIIHSMRRGGFNVFLVRLAGAGVVTLLLCAAKLYAAIAYIGHFPRDYYPLPGIPDVARLLGVLLEALFFFPDNATGHSLVNNIWPMKRHEFEFGVTFIPLLATAVLLGWLIFRWRRGKNVITVSIAPAVFAKIALLVVLLAIPLALNFYQEGWNAFLKQVPLIKSSSILVRWFAVYIPVAILGSALILQGWECRRVTRIATAMVLSGLVVVINAFVDKQYYEQQNYNPTPVIEAYRKARVSGAQDMDYIAVVTKNGRISMPNRRNDTMTRGGSQLFCYEPEFGYLLEDFQRKTLTPGPVTTAVGGYLNMKNPACYVYPRENQCLPGDHFRVTEMQQLLLFKGHHPYPFQISGMQVAANGITLVAIFGYVALLAVAGVRVALISRKPAAPPQR